MSHKRTCPQCGKERTDDSLSGLCPNCLALHAFSETEEGTNAVASAGNAAPTLRVAPSSDFELHHAGVMIGRYKLLEQIGEGGFGVVYMAEQVEPVRRKVALKVIKAGMDTRAVVARFEAERQALALMDHPNIARVLDAGTTQAGRPYFVMELVRGIPITEFCDQKKLPTRERLELFITVCHAVQHAHQKGIIHRDLKPGNVLVTLQDGKPVPKVIDFGVALALGHRLTKKTLFTGFTHMIGTPAYMSPEQAEMSGLDVDTRSDIYSLGVLLYELLTGGTPFDRKTLDQAALDEVRRTIRETDPPKPSTRLQTLGEKLRAVAESRHAEAPQLVHLVKGDLDWIVMTCLDKDRKRRYETANGVAMDVKRYLANEPIVARPPSKLYEFQKTVRRHKFGFIAAGSVMAALMVGLLASLWQARRADLQRINAEHNSDIARAEAEKTHEVVEFLKDILQTEDPGDKTLRELMDQFAPQVATRFKNQPEVELELRRILGSAYRGLALYPEANEHLTRALQLQRELHGEQHIGTAALLCTIALQRWQENHDEDVTALLLQAASIYRTHHDVEGELDARAALVEPLLSQGRHDEAKRYAAEALDFIDRFHVDKPVAKLDLTLILSEIEKSLGNDEAADRLADEALTQMEQAPRRFSGMPWHVYLHLGEVLYQGGSRDEAADCFRQGLKAARKVAPENNHRVRSTKFLLMEVLQAQENDSALGELATLRSSFPSEELRKILKYRAWNALIRLRDADRALALVRRAIKIKPEGGFANELAWWSATNPRSPFRDSGEGIQFAELALETEPRAPDYWNTLGVAHYRADHMEATVEALNKAVALRGQGLPCSGFFLAMAHWELGQKQEAQEHYDEAVKWMTESKPADDELPRFRGEAASLLGIKDAAAVNEPEATAENKTR